jgi:hypothetical protein
LLDKVVVEPAARRESPSHSGALCASRVETIFECFTHWQYYNKKLLALQPCLKENPLGLKPGGFIISCK